MCSCLPYLGTESNREQVLNKCLLEEWAQLRSLCCDGNTNRHVVSRKSVKSHWFSAHTFYTSHQAQNMFHLVSIILTLTKLHAGEPFLMTPGFCLQGTYSLCN